METISIRIPQSRIAAIEVVARKRGEVDFVIDHPDGRVLPIEVFSLGAFA